MTQCWYCANDTKFLYFSVKIYYRVGGGGGHRKMAAISAAAGNIVQKSSII